MQKQGQLHPGEYPAGPDLATALDEFEGRAFVNQCLRDPDLARHGIPADLPMIVTRIRWTWASRWTFADEGEGEFGAVVVVQDEGEPLDLAAWSPADPSRWGFMFGAAVALGLERIDHAGSYTWDTPLPVFRTPLGWAKAGGKGACFKHDHDLRLLERAHGRIVCEDRDHALTVARWACLSPFMSADRIGFRRAAV
ncbi:hypothetical protein [Phreatobacter sp.]|uniref:hypothetical protein n=1 Tax=Phreatobacter sp. TaxID=1966341 RepID=UPI003F71EC00